MQCLDDIRVSVNDPTSAKAYTANEWCEALAPGAVPGFLYPAPAYHQHQASDTRLTVGQPLGKPTADLGRHLSKMPPEVLHLFLDYLDLVSLIRLHHASRAFRELVCNHPKFHAVFRYARDAIRVARRTGLLDRHPLRKWYIALRTPFCANCDTKKLAGHVFLPSLIRQCQSCQTGPPVTLANSISNNILTHTPTDTKYAKVVTRLSLEMTAGYIMPELLLRFGGRIRYIETGRMGTSQEEQALPFLEVYEALRRAGMPQRHALELVTTLEADDRAEADKHFLLSAGMPYYNPALKDDDDEILVCRGCDARWWRAFSDQGAGRAEYQARYTLHTRKSFSKHSIDDYVFHDIFEETDGNLDVLLGLLQEQE